MDYKEVFELAYSKGYNLSEFQPGWIEDYVEDWDEEDLFCRLCIIQKWLRDQYKVQMSVMAAGPINDLSFACIIPTCYYPDTAYADERKKEGGLPGGRQTSYELALLHGVYEALKLIP